VARQLLAAVNSAPDRTIIINIQGDQPFFDPALIDAIATSFIARQPNPEVLTPIYRLSAEKLHNHNVVKVLLAADGRGLFFPFGPAPCTRCADVLLRWPQLPISPLEELEKLEQLGLIEAGIRIDTLEVERGQFSVDTPEQLEQARAIATGRSW
jgi:3-deoxy-manno-octulosonate cytidylyltransferase (CMP-KDO synthetase)